MIRAEVNMLSEKNQNIYQKAYFTVTKLTDSHRKVNIT